MHKTIYPCKGLIINISLEEGNLSFDGSLYHPIRDAHGQIQNHLSLLEPLRFNEGWNKDKLDELLEVWNRWHLNDLRAGSPDQESALREIEILGDYYPQAVAYLESLGLQPDPNYLVDGKPYSYGTHWLKEEIPEEVIKYLESL